MGKGFGVITMDEFAAERIGDQVSSFVASERIELRVLISPIAGCDWREVDFTAYRIGEILRQTDLRNGESIDRAIAEIAPYIGQVPPGAQRDALLARIGTALMMSTTTMSRLTAAGPTHPIRQGSTSDTTDANPTAGRGHSTLDQVSAPVPPRQSADDLDD